MTLTLAAARKQRRELDRQRHHATKRAAKDKVRGLKRAIAIARAGRKLAIKDARTRCKRERLAVRENIKEARAQLKRQAAELRESSKAARHYAKQSCCASKKAAKSLEPVERAKALHAAEKAYQAELRTLDRHAQERASGVLRARPGLARATRRSESDDEVRGNIPPDFVALFERVKGKIRASDRASRTENFLKYAEEHPHEIVNAIEAVSEVQIARLERAHRNAQVHARKRRYSAAELAEVPF